MMMLRLRMTIRHSHPRYSSAPGLCVSAFHFLRLTLWVATGFQHVPTNSLSPKDPKGICCRLSSSMESEKPPHKQGISHGLFPEFLTVKSLELFGHAVKTFLSFSVRFWLNHGLTHICNDPFDVLLPQKWWLPPSHA